LTVSIRVWRLTKIKFAATPLDGEGARLYGGRWNHPGTALVYTSSTLALAQLELLVHVDRSDAPRDLLAVELEIPDKVAMEILAPSVLPRRWRVHPAPAALAKIGGAWAASA
jgi:RES domain-containing protein